MLALEVCRSGATDQEILDWLDEATPPVLRQSVEELQHLRGSGGSLSMEDEAITVACLCAANDPRETFELVCWQWAPVERGDLVRQLLHRRTTSWCNRFARVATTTDLGGAWWLIRLLVLEGLAERPGGNYLERMVAYLVKHPYETRDGPRVAAALRQDPGLLETEVWEVLATARRLGPAWLSALVELAEEGHRDRLLDSAWRILISDGRPVDQRWFLDLVQQLQPSTGELSSRQVGLLRMTGSANGPVVLWALAGLRILFEAGRVEVDDLLSVRAPLQRRDKRTALAHIALLATAAKRFPSRGNEVAETVAVALDHERRDVRERAQLVLERVSLDGPKRRAPADVRTLELGPKARPGPAAFEPLQSAPQLVELLLTLMATPGSAVDVERAIDGAIRFKHDITESGRTALDQGWRAGPDNGGYLFGAHTLARTLAAPWLSCLGDASWSENVYDADHQRSGVRDVSLTGRTDVRLRQVSMAIQSPITQSLSTPTTNDGSLTLGVLRERLRTTQGAPAFWSDVDTAAFRIAPEEYSAIETIRFSTVGRVIAADVLRIAGHQSQWEILPCKPGIAWHDRAPKPALAKGVAGSMLEALPESSISDPWLDRSKLSREAQLTTLWSLLLPHHRELHAAHAFPLVAATLDWDYSIFGQLILSLGEGREVTSPVAVSALACALAARRIEHRGAAIDAVVELATYGLLDGAELGRQISQLFTEGQVVVGSRIATALAEAGRALGPRSGPVLDAHIPLLPVLCQRRDGHAFAETTADLATSLGRRIVLPPELAELAGGHASSALARAVRRIPKPI